MSFLNTLFTRKFSIYLLSKLNLPEKIKLLNDKQIDKIIGLIKSFSFKVKGVWSLEKVYVTAGEIDLKYINTQTMESKINKGIYFVGEALDIHGHIGGYNITLVFSDGVYCRK